MMVLLEGVVYLINPHVSATSQIHTSDTQVPLFHSLQSYSYLILHREREAGSGIKNESCISSDARQSHIRSFNSLVLTKSPR